MKVTPLDIKQRTFEKKTFGGVDKEEVDAYLNQLALAWEKIIDENKELKLRLEASEVEAQKLRRLESTLYLTLKTAEETGANLVNQSKQSAAITLREANAEAQQLIKDATWKAKAIADNIKAEAEKSYTTLHTAVKQLEQESKTIENMRDNVLQELRNLGNDIFDKIERQTTRKQKISFTLPDNKIGKAIDEAIESLHTNAQVSINNNFTEVASQNNYPKAVTNPNAHSEGPIKENTQVNNDLNENLVAFDYQRVTMRERHLEEVENEALPHTLTAETELNSETESVAQSIESVSGPKQPIDLTAPPSIESILASFTEEEDETKTAKVSSNNRSASYSFFAPDNVAKSPDEQETPVKPSITEIPAVVVPKEMPKSEPIPPPKEAPAESPQIIDPAPEIQPQQPETPKITAPQGSFFDGIM